MLGRVSEQYRPQQSSNCCNEAQVSSSISLRVRQLANVVLKKGGDPVSHCDSGVLEAGMPISRLSCIHMDFFVAGAIVFRLVITLEAYLRTSRKSNHHW